MTEANAVRIVCPHGVGEHPVQVRPVNLVIGRTILLKRQIAAIDANQDPSRLIVVHGLI